MKAAKKQAKKEKRAADGKSTSKSADGKSTSKSSKPKPQEAAKALTSAGTGTSYKSKEYIESDSSD